MTTLGQCHPTPWPSWTMSRGLGSASLSKLLGAAVVLAVLAVWVYKQLWFKLSSAVGELKVSCLSRLWVRTSLKQRKKDQLNIFQTSWCIALICISNRQAEASNSKTLSIFPFLRCCHHPWKRSSCNPRQGRGIFWYFSTTKSQGDSGNTALKLNDDFNDSASQPWKTPTTLMTLCCLYVTCTCFVFSPEVIHGGSNSEISAMLTNSMAAPQPKATDATSIGLMAFHQDISYKIFKYLIAKYTCLFVSRKYVLIGIAIIAIIAICNAFVPGSWCGSEAPEGQFNAKVIFHFVNRHHIIIY